MMALVRLALGLLLTLGALTSPALANLRVTSEAQGTVANTRQVVVHSEIVGRDFVVTISAPNDAALRAGGPKLPTAYALDGGWGVAGPIAQLLARDRTMNPFLVVSIGYPGDAPLERNADLLYRPVAGSPMAEGAQFERFLLEELRPFVESRYPVDPARTVLFGHSFGGLFAANLLARQPDAFRDYVIGSAPVGLDPETLNGLRAVSSRLGGKRIFVGVASEDSDMAADAVAIASALAGATVEHRVFHGESHLSYYPALAAASFRWLMGTSGDATAATPQQGIERLAGRYRFPDGQVSIIEARDGRLFQRFEGLRGEAEMHAESGTRFTLPDFGVVIEFEADELSPPTAIRVITNGTERRGERLIENPDE